MTTKVLILGASGMLGHQLVQVCKREFDTYGTVRINASDDAVHKTVGLEPSRLIQSVYANELDTIETAIRNVKPTVVINCIGVVKQAAEGLDPARCISVNSLFPHQVASICRSEDIRFITVSTDCVFSGRKGNYTELDTPDPADLYGRSKLLGEVDGPGCLTIRTSLIGRQLANDYGLLEWFLSCAGGTVTGYENAVFNGLTTRAFSEVLLQVIATFPDLKGVFHVSSTAISKYDLLCLINETHDLGVKIIPDKKLVCDRSLDSGRFRELTAIRLPEWEEMIEQLEISQSVPVV